MLFFGRKSQQRAVPDESILFLLVMVGEVRFVVLIQFSDIRAELTRSGVNFLVDCLSTASILSLSLLILAWNSLELASILSMSL